MVRYGAGQVYSGARGLVGAVSPEVGGMMDIGMSVKSIGEGLFGAGTSIFDTISSKNIPSPSNAPVSSGSSDISSIATPETGTGKIGMKSATLAQAHAASKTFGLTSFQTPSDIGINLSEIENTDDKDNEISRTEATDSEEKGPEDFIEMESSTIPERNDEDSYHDDFVHTAEQETPTGAGVGELRRAGRSIIGAVASRGRSAPRS